MKHILEDGRELVASYKDIQAFFDRNHIAGRTIRDLRSYENDYMIKNLDDFDIETLSKWTTESAIDTDGQIAIIFSDGDHMEIEFSGNGPILLGFNTADFSKYPEYNGTCYTLRTLFQHCIGRTVDSVFFEKTDRRMEFPAYCGIDMSEDDEGIQEIRLILDDESYLSFSGNIDFFRFMHQKKNGEELRVQYSELLKELSSEMMNRIFTQKEGY